MKVALYCRVSHEDQVKFGVSIEAQKNDLIKYCKDKKYSYDLYCDEGISAKSMNRPELKRMLDNIENYKMILFTKLDRLSRNVLDANIINNLLVKHNVAMKAIFEDDIDTSTADGKFMFDLKNSLAERELRKDSERIKQVMNYKLNVAKTVVSGAKVYGYDIVDKKYVVNELEAKRINELFDKYIETASLNKTYLWWHEQNYTGSTIATLRSWLVNPRFIGKYMHNGKAVDDFIPQIVDNDKFEKVQKLIKQNHREYSVSKYYYIFKGIIRCGECGCVLSGTHKKYYKCERHKTYTCNNNAYVLEKVIEQEVLKQLPILYEDIKNKQKNMKPVKIVDNTSNIKIKIDRLQNLYIDGLIDKETYTKKYEDLKSKLEQEKRKIKPTSNIAKIDKIFKNKKYMDLYNELDNIHKGEFFREILDSVVLNADRTIEVYLNVE